jgi:DNA-binding PadR family transcriptional regulator
MARPSCDEVLPLTPAVLHILLALAEGERHGYAIMQSVGGSLRMGPGTLYGTLKRLLAAGLVTESDERPDPEPSDVRRRYYALTPRGLEVLRAELERLDRTLKLPAAMRLMQGGPA